MPSRRSSTVRRRRSCRSSVVRESWESCALTSANDSFSRVSSFSETVWRICSSLASLSAVMAARRSSSVWRMRSCRVSMAMEASESCRAVAEADIVWLSSRSDCSCPSRAPRALSNIASRRRSSISACSSSMRSSMASRSRASFRRKSARAASSASNTTAAQTTAVRAGFCSKIVGMASSVMKINTYIIPMIAAVVHAGGKIRPLRDFPLPCAGKWCILY